MPGLDPGIHAWRRKEENWMAGMNPAMTKQVRPRADARFASGTRVRPRWRTARLPDGQISHREAVFVGGGLFET
jgi:hypothetical protein